MPIGFVCFSLSAAILIKHSKKGFTISPDSKAAPKNRNLKEVANSLSHAPVVQLGRDSRLKIYPVSVRIRLGVPFAYIVQLEEY